MSQTDKTSKDSNTKQKGEAELLAQLQKLQQEININLPKTSNTVIGAKRKTDGTTPVPNKKPTFVPRTVTKEEKIISAAPTYNVSLNFYIIDFLISLIILYPVNNYNSNNC